MQRSFAKARNALERFIESSLRLDTPNSPGVTRRQTLEKARKANPFKRTEQQLAIQYAELAPVEIPPVVTPLLKAFRQLSARRSFNKSGPLPLSYQEIQAFDRLTCSDFTPWEVETLCSMDGVYINTWIDLSESASRDPS